MRSATRNLEFSGPYTKTNTVSSKTLWGVRIAAAIAALFLILSGTAKVVAGTHNSEALARPGYPAALASDIESALPANILLGVVPRTSVLGPILLPGYPGRTTIASCTLELLLPIVLGLLLWAELSLRDIHPRKSTEHPLPH